jgi:DNA-binding transcriptional MerR regulator
VVGADLAVPYSGWMPDAAPRALTIDELAREVGMTVRNVRAYRSRGLLPEPELRGRKGYYGPDHVARLELISELREQGFNLEAIARIIERAPGDSVTEVLDFTRAVHAPFADEPPRVVTASVFVERWGEQLTPELARRAQRLGFVRHVGEDRYEIPSPRLERAAIALRDLGVPLADVLDIGALLGRHARAVARAYVELFNERVWRPFEQAGEPKEEWPRVHDALERLRPLAGESLLATFQAEMMRAIEAALEGDLADMDDGAEPAPGGRRRGSGRERPGGRRRAARR